MTEETAVATRPEPESGQVERLPAARLVAMAIFKSYGVRDASNGATISGTIEVAPVFATDFDEMLGEQTFNLKLGKKSLGECRITGVTTKADADNQPYTRIALGWSADQRPATRAIVDLVGEPVRLEFHAVQMPIWGGLPAGGAPDEDEPPTA